MNAILRLLRQFLRLVGDFRAARRGRLGERVARRTMRKAARKATRTRPPR